MPPEVHGRSDWYTERAEPERTWRGVLRRREPPVGPDARTALTYTFISTDGEIDVYAAHVEEILAPLVGLLVMARGKLIDLSDEGYGAELWVGSIEPVDAGEE